MTNKINVEIENNFQRKLYICQHKKYHKERNKHRKVAEKEKP